MSIFKWLTTFLIVIIASLGGFLYYSFNIEPYQVEVVEYVSVKDKEAEDEIKVVQFSDVHIKEDFTHENLEEAVNKINDQKPDFVVFTGDLYDNYSIYNDDANIIATLNKIESKLGKIAIWGNRDYGGGAAQHYAQIMQKAGFVLLSNQSQVFSLENNKKVLFTGLDDALLGAPDLESSKIDESVDYSILLSHEPDFINQYDTSDYNIILAGHSHGGQVHIPFIPSVNQTGLSHYSHSKKYSKGFYDLHKEGDKKIYVNSGIGTTHISARFGVVPEITLFRILI